MNPPSLYSSIKKQRMTKVKLAKIAVLALAVARVTTEVLWVVAFNRLNAYAESGSRRMDQVAFPSQKRFEHERQRPFVNVPPPLSIEVISADAEYGQIAYSPVERRTVQEDDVLRFEQEREHIFEVLATSTEEEAYWQYLDRNFVDFDDIRPSWTYTMKPTCNPIHEVSGENHRFLGNGYYREAFLVDRGTVGDFVLKRQRLLRDWNRNRLERVVTEALIMERLTQSPHISELYGHCGFTGAVELSPVSVSKKILSYTGFQLSRGIIDQAYLDSQDDVHPLNNITDIEKLDILLLMAGSIADAHGFDTGPLVIRDIAINQWVQTEDKRVVLNDFDNAVFMAYNLTSGSYSPIFSGYVGGLKAPEEIEAEYVPSQTEQSDIWKVGGLIFSALTGLLPYYNELHHALASGDETNTAADAKIEAGIPPYLDPRYTTRSFIEGRLVDIMEQCYRREKGDRVSIFQVVEYLQETKRQYYAHGQGISAGSQ